MGNRQSLQKDLDFYSTLLRGSCVVLSDGIQGVKADDKTFIMPDAKGVIIEVDFAEYLASRRWTSIDTIMTEKVSSVFESSQKAQEFEFTWQYYLWCLERAQGCVGKKFKNEQEFPTVCYGLESTEKSEYILRIAGF